MSRRLRLFLDSFTWRGELGRDEGKMRRGKKKKACFNLLIPSLPIRSHIKQITQNAPLHTSVSLPISPYSETLGK